MQPFSKVVASPPATLPFDLSVSDEELGDLLAHRWTVCLAHSSLGIPRKDDPTEPKVIAPPPSSAVLTWEFSALCSVTAGVLMRDTEIVKTWPLQPRLKFLAGDSLRVTVTLTVDS